MATATPATGENGRHERPVDATHPAVTRDAPGGGETHGAHEAHSGREAQRGNKWWTLVAVCLGTFMLLLDVTIVNVALPDIQTSLHASFSDLQWVVDAYALTLAALLLTSGSLADQYGRRKLYAIGLVLFTLASLGCGLAPTSLFLQLARGVQGLGGSVMLAVSLALLADAFRGKDRGLAFSIWGAITGIAVAVGPLLGGALTSGLSWRWIFFVNLPVGIAALVISLTRVAESRADHVRRPDWVGFVTFTGSLASLVYALIESGERGFTDARVLACYAAAALLLVVFLVTELRNEHAMFDLTLLRLPTFTGGLVAAFGLSSTLFAMLLYLILYLQDLLGYSPLQTGLRIIVISGAIFVVSIISGRLSSFVPVRLLIGPGLALTGLGLLLMSGLHADSSWTHLIPGFVIGGAGAGLVNPPLASTAVGVVQPQRAGMASGINSTFRQVGIATGIALFGTLFASRSSDVVRTRLAAIPAARGHAGQLALAIRSGDTGRALAAIPAGSRAAVEQAARAAFTAGLDRILVVAGIVALVSAVICLLTIRTRDFVQHGAA